MLRCDSQYSIDDPFPVKFVSHATEPDTHFSNEFIYNNVLESKIKGFLNNLISNKFL